MSTTTGHRRRSLPAGRAVAVAATLATLLGVAVATGVAALAGDAGTPLADGAAVTPGTSTARPTPATADQEEPAAAEVLDASLPATPARPATPAVAATLAPAPAARAAPAVEPAPEAEAAPAPVPESDAPEALVVVGDRSATTGVPQGVVLTPMSGGTVTATGTIANRVIEGNVVFTGSNLTVRNVRVTGHAVFRGDDVLIEDSEFGSWALSGSERVRAARVEVFGNPGQDGLHITSDTGPVRDVVVTDSWIHNPLVLNGSHYDGIQVRGVERLTVRNVLIDLGTYATGHNAALFLEDANGGNRDVLVEGSQLLGGGYTIVSFGANVRVESTVVRPGRWGYLNPTSWALASFAGNTSDSYAPLAYDGRDVVVGGPAIVTCYPVPDPPAAAAPLP